MLVQETTIVPKLAPKTLLLQDSPIGRIDTATNRTRLTINTAVDLCNWLTTRVKWSRPFPIGDAAREMAVAREIPAAQPYMMFPRLCKPFSGRIAARKIVKVSTAEQRQPTAYEGQKALK